jgi:hypothetical protein
MGEKMLRGIMVAGFFFSTLGQMAYSEGAPELRPNECLATYDKIDDGLVIRSYADAMLLILQRRVTDFPDVYTSKDVQERTANIENSPLGYEIFERVRNKRRLLVRYDSEDGYTARSLDFEDSSKQSMSVKDYLGIEGSMLKITIEWEPDGSFSYGSDYSKIGSDGLLVYAGSELTFLGELTCFQGD